MLDDPETEEFITDFIDYLEDEDDFWNLTVYAYDYVVDEKGMLDEISPLTIIISSELLSILLIAVVESNIIWNRLSLYPAFILQV